MLVIYRYLKKFYKSNTIFSKIQINTPMFSSCNLRLAASLSCFTWNSNALEIVLAS